MHIHKWQRLLLCLLWKRKIIIAGKSLTIDKSYIIIIYNIFIAKYFHHLLLLLVRSSIIMMMTIQVIKVQKFWQKKLLFLLMLIFYECKFRQVFFANICVYKYDSYLSMKIKLIYLIQCLYSELSWVMKMSLNSKSIRIEESIKVMPS